MLPILTPAQAMALDRDAAARGVAVLDLMERAGRAVARAAQDIAGGAYGRRAVVVCGSGNNGGDGLVAARHLERAGLGVAAVLIAGPSSFAGPAAENFRRFHASGGRWRTLGEGSPGMVGLRRELSRADVAIDAMFGTGFHGPAAGTAAAAIEAVNASAAAVVAVDIPSGVDGESGAVAGPAIEADTTVTFGALKPGVAFYPGAAFAGEVLVADIGFPPDLVRSDLVLVESRDVAPPVVDREAHKRSRGTALIVAGSRRMTGAAALCASSAGRAGAGLVVLAVPESIVPVVQGLVPEAVFAPLPETPEGTIAASAVSQVLERAADAHAVAIGPGLTTNEETAQAVRRLVAECERPMVVDADGLGAFAGRAELLAERRAPAVLTPHAGEFGRLVGMSAQDVGADRVGLVRKAAEELRCTVLLKGPRTLVADPDGIVRVNPTGGPSLATGGTGDVLTGMVAAHLAARRGEPTTVAVAAAFEHGLAGDLAASELGDGMVASDLLRFVPVAVFRRFAGPS
jgi:NAD(P)H-hydrate epimerase